MLIICCHCSSQNKVRLLVALGHGDLESACISNLTIVNGGFPEATYLWYLNQAQKHYEFQPANNQVCCRYYYFLLSLVLCLCLSHMHRVRVDKVVVVVLRRQSTFSR